MRGKIRKGLKHLNIYFWKRLFPLLVTSILTLVLYFIGDYLATRRDTANKQRDLRIEYLISAYSKLADATQRTPESGSQYFANVEAAMANIQLFGTDSQIEKACRMMDDYQEKRYLNLNELLRELRDDLRAEMDLSEVKRDVQWIRFHGVVMPRQTSKQR